MTAKNVARLKLIGPDQIKALYQLPAVLLQRVGLRIKSGHATTKDMIDAQIAVAIAILLHVPLRAANLVSLEIGRQLVLPPTDTQEAVLHFEYTVVKNSYTLDFKLPPDVTALIRKYMMEFQPYFARTCKTPALFPGCENPTKTTTNLGEQITARLQTAIGVTMNQHLVALIYLKRNPGEYAAVQRLLGHKHLKTTLEYYCGVEVEALLAHVTASMAKIKEEMGLDPNDMSKLREKPKPATARKAAPESKQQIRRGFFSRPAAPVLTRGSVVVGGPSATGQGLANVA